MIPGLTSSDFDQVVAAAGIVGTGFADLEPILATDLATQWRFASSTAGISRRRPATRPESCSRRLRV